MNEGTSLFRILPYQNRRDFRGDQEDFMGFIWYVSEDLGENYSKTEPRVFFQDLEDRNKEYTRGLGREGGWGPRR